MKKIPVYLMPGLATSAAIFERIELPEDKFEVFFLEWIEPLKKESLKNYAQRMSKLVLHDEVVLIGVSFGGILIQEMKEFLTIKKIIIISSVKSWNELPLKMKFSKTTKIYKVLPTSLVSKLNLISKLTFGTLFKNRLELYKKYLTISDTNYLDWSITQIVTWDRKIVDPEIIHIHGTNDRVFPIKNCKNCILVKDGTHIMILNRFRWFNDHLTEIILK